MSKYNVFLSHSSRDKDIVRRIDRQLKSAGFGTWLDENDIAFGKSISSEIQSGLDKSDIILIFLSEYSVSSKWVEAEWQAKFFESISKDQIGVVPILLSDCKIPAFLRDKKYVDFRKMGEFDASLALLLSFLSEQRSDSKASMPPSQPINGSVLSSVREILEDLEGESISFPFRRGIKIVKTLKKVPRSGKQVRLKSLGSEGKPRSIYDHVLSLAHLADCVIPYIEHNLKAGDIRDLGLCIAYHELNEVILGDIPSYTSLTRGTRRMIGVFAEERIRSVAPDEREKIANELIWMFLGDKHRAALRATMDIFQKSQSGIFPIFRALDKMDPIVAVWRYLHHFRGKLGSTPQTFNKVMKDFYENPDIKSYMAEHKLDSRLIETVAYLQDRSNSWEYYVNRDSVFQNSRMTIIPQDALLSAIEGVPLFSE
ncbi:MAG: toll/interleukin-1 receptor domain-containing protein [Hyphomonas sp.]|nr:toll/interleukin-1 receptor domain-containing protein [Hyphomonas sp.]